MSAPSSSPLLIQDGQMQSDLNANFHRILNLDTSNFPPSGIPPTVHPSANQWLHDWDNETQTWTATQPFFTSIGGSLTSIQQQAITSLGTISHGTWRATLIEPAYLPDLSGIRHPSGDVDMAGFKLTGLADPSAATDAVNKRFMDLLLEGLNPKGAVRCASTGIVSHLDGLGTAMDGITLLSGDRVLVKDQPATRLYENGIYNASTTFWTRVTDADTAAEIAQAYCTVLEGTENGGSGWVQVNTPADPLWEPSDSPPGSGHDVNFVLFSQGSTGITAGAGLQKIGSEISAVGTTNRITIGSGIDIASNYVGQSSITTLGTISTGTWQGTILSSIFGGTGVDNGGNRITLGAGDFSITTKPSDVISFPQLILRIRGTGSSVLDLPFTGTVATLDGDETFTNKRITQRYATIASNALPSINIDTTDVFSITALATNITSMSTNLTGTPTNGQELVIWIKDNGTARTITWGAKFNGGDTALTTLPVVTIAGKWMFLEFKLQPVTGLSLNPPWVLTQKVTGI